MQGSTAIANLLLTHGADVNASARYCGVTHLPLQAAAAKGHLEIIHTSLMHSSHINGVTEDGWTVIYWAAQNGHHDALCPLMADYHTDKHMRLVYGSSAFHLAAAHGYSRCIDVCLEAGLDVDMLNNDRMTALHRAVTTSYQVSIFVTSLCRAAPPPSFRSLYPSLFLRTSGSYPRAEWLP